MARGRGRSTAYVAAAQIGQEGLGLFRNVILARALGPSEMGTVAALALTASLLEMVSDFGPDRLLVQAEDGDREEFQATAQTLLVGRGLLCAILLAILAIPAGLLLGRPDAAWMIAALGAVTAIRGLMHLDCKRVQRNHEFRRMMVVELSGAVLATAGTLILTRLIGNAWVLVCVNLIQVLTVVGLSHLVADRKYGLGIERDLLGRLWKFGWPLAVNSLIMFGAMQGDRLVVLATASPADLGRYAVVFQLTLVPALLISRIASTAWLPSLARVQNDRTAFATQISQITTLIGGVALVFSLGILLTGNLVIGLLYGDAFKVSMMLMCWLAVMQGLRIVRAAPSLVAMSRADSLNPLAANILRCTGIAAAAVAGGLGAGLETIAACGAVGELVALTGSVVFLARRHAIDPRPIAQATLLFVLGTGAGWVLVSAGWENPLVSGVAAAVVALCVGIAVARIVQLRSHREAPAAVSLSGACLPALAEKGN
ncbi:MAG: oligosaccharide flippase family protein [Planctomycetes bacterium]|nr:oligosaccharide flippase family protein [Planctomycetota bacterium]